VMSAANQDLIRRSFVDEPRPPISHDTAEDWPLRLTRLLDGTVNLDTHAERTDCAPAGCCSAEPVAAARRRLKTKSAVSADTLLMRDDLGEISNPAQAFSVQPKKIANSVVSVWQYLRSYLSRWRDSQRYSVHEDYKDYGRWLRRDLGVTDHDMDWPGLR
jgi:hypothetical protein